MKNTLILLVLSSMVLNTVAQEMDHVDCYYGWTTDKDDDIEEDWDTKCPADDDDLPNSDGAGCQNVRCEGGCFKARFEGDDGFVSFYGCVDTPGNIESTGYYPGGFSAEDLGMSNLPTEDDECNSEDSFNVPTMDNGVLQPPFDELGEDTEDYSAEWCYCVANQCNGAEKIVAAFGVVVSIAIATMV